LSFDPENEALEDTGPWDFVMCGVPRSGTTLLAAALFQPPHVVTSVEPWDGLRMPPAQLFNSLREEVESTGGLSRGRLDVDALEAHGSVRWTRDGSSTYSVDTSGDWHLGVKWTAYWRLLGRLQRTKFLVCLRDPVETIASFAKSGGRLAEGLDYDVAIHAEMNRALVEATDDARIRRVLMYEYVNSRIVPHLDQPNVFAVRYERWFTDPAGLLADIGRFLGVDVGSSKVRLARAYGDAAESHERATIRELCPSARALGYEV
jgi:hypothetical protein